MGLPITLKPGEALSVPAGKVVTVDKLLARAQRIITSRMNEALAGAHLYDVLQADGEEGQRALTATTIVIQRPDPQHKAITVWMEADTSSSADFRDVIAPLRADLLRTGRSKAELILLGLWPCDKYLLIAAILQMECPGRFERARYFGEPEPGEFWPEDEPVEIGQYACETGAAVGIDDGRDLFDEEGC
jgi:hypothetical protein